MIAIPVATLSDYDAIKEAFGQNRNIFPHIRTDYIYRMIEKSNCVYSDGVIIMYNFYKRNNNIGNVIAPRGSCTIKQILNTQKGNGNAGKLLNEFLQWCERDVYLSVRADNLRAINFYKKNDFQLIGDISWKSGTLPGHVYYWKYKNQELPCS
jgi:RimJ/RimL family protein N-acetyltransferase